MVVPLAGRSVAAVAGGLLVLTAWASIIGTLIVPRPVSSWLTRWADRSVNWAFRLVTGAVADHQRRDQILASQAPATLLAQLIAWLAISFLWYMLLLGPWETGGLASAFTSVFVSAAVAASGAHRQAMAAARASRVLRGWKFMSSPS